MGFVPHTFVNKNKLSQDQDTVIENKQIVRGQNTIANMFRNAPKVPQGLKRTIN